jgi:hypothetical protein
MTHLCNRCVREFLLLARTWFAFGSPSKPGVTPWIINVEISSQSSYRTSQKIGPCPIFDHVYKINNALYGLKKVPKAWYECLRVWIVTCLDAKFMDDIIFRSTNCSSCEEFSRIMVKKFDVSMME